MRSRIGAAVGMMGLLGLVVASSPARAVDAAPAAERAKQVSGKGLEFLKSKQNPDGGWQGPNDPPGVSALVLRAFAVDPRYGSKADFVASGYKHLLSYQQSNGGIYQDALANYNTAIAVSTLSSARDPGYAEKIDRAVAFLKGVQITEKSKTPQGAAVTEKDPSYGGIGYGPGGRQSRPDLSNTQTMLDALHDAGLKPDDPAFKAALAFVSRSQNRSESNDQAWAGDDGGFVYTPANGGNSNAGEYTGPDGKRLLRSYGLMTYAGLKSMIYAGLSKEDPRVKAAWDWIRGNWTLDENPGMRLAGEGKATSGMYYYYHTLARALAAYGEPVIVDKKGQKHDWRVELVDKLASLQNPDGSWVGGKEWMENNPVLTTAYVVLALEEVSRDLAEHPPTP